MQIKLSDYCKLLVAGCCMAISTMSVQAEEMQQGEMTVVYAKGYEPFSWKGKNGEVNGVEVELLEVLLKEKMGISLIHKSCPWARCQNWVKKGLNDAFLTIPTPERKAYAEITDLPIFTTKFFIYVGHKNPKLSELREIKTLSELKSRNDIILGQILGAGWHGIHYQGAKKISKAANSVQILKMLELNRVDVYVEQAPLLRYQIKSLAFEGKILEMPHAMDVVPWHLHISKKSPFLRILPKFNKLLEDMEKDGSMAKLREKIFQKYQ